MRNVTLGADGYFIQNNARLVPVGVNYWPGSCGVELWQAWPVDEIRRDLEIVSQLGLNTIRFFLRWQDFEPLPGQYDQRMWDRLRALLRWCRDARIIAHPSLFVGWMSGGVFWPKWKENRNLYSDTIMRTRAVEFARIACAQMRGFEDILLAVDLGNELDCLADCQSASPRDVRDWCEQICQAVHQSLPNTLIVSGNDQNQITRDTGWRFGEQPGADFLSVHTYPVPSWHSVEFDGMTDPLAARLLPLYTKCARAFAPVMVQEFGTIITFGAEQQDQYLRHLLPALWEAGSNGFLWWCLRDIDSTGHPYEKTCFEANLGLVDRSGKVKPGLEYYLEFAKQLPQMVSLRRNQAVGLLWPSQYYPRDNPLNVGNDPGIVSQRMLLANHMLEHLGVKPAVVREDGEWHADLRTIVVAGASIGHAGAERLRAFVERGGNVILHGIDPMTLGPALIALLGAQPVDLRRGKPTAVEFAGQRWELSFFLRNTRTELSVKTAQVFARDDANHPAVLRNRVGDGQIVYTIACIEDAVAAENSREDRDRWAQWYRAELDLLDSKPVASRTNAARLNSLIS